MRFTKSQKIGLVIAAALITLSLILPNFSAAAGQKVIGKLHLKTGANVIVFIPGPGGAVLPFNGTAFEDQTLYITKITTGEGIKAYRADGNGFAHDCPTHGKEVFNNEDIIVAATQEMVDESDLISVEIFDTE